MSTISGFLGRRGTGPGTWLPEGVEGIARFHELYQLLRRLLGLVRAHRTDVLSNEAEILVLRHQLAVLRHPVVRPRFSWSDRALVALLANLVPRQRWSSFLVTPQTVLDWHRRLVRRQWTYPHRRPGRPSLANETVDLICRLARENSRWATCASWAN